MSFINLPLQDVVHEWLEGSRWVGKPKEHYCWFKQATVCSECCFPFISFLDPDIVVSPPHLKNYLFPRQTLDNWGSLGIYPNPNMPQTVWDLPGSPGIHINLGFNPKLGCPEVSLSLPWCIPEASLRLPWGFPEATSRAPSGSQGFKFQFYKKEIRIWCLGTVQSSV